LGNADFTKILNAMKRQGKEKIVTKNWEGDVQGKIRGEQEGGIRNDIGVAG
jgi:hypothetical protein